MRITYTVPYTWTSSPLETTTPAQDFFAICHLAAGLCCQAIAAKYSKLGDSTITADVVSGPGLATNFAARAKEFFALYVRSTWGWARRRT